MHVWFGPSPGHALRPNGNVRAGLHAARSRARLPARTVPCAPPGVRRPGRPPPKRQRARRTARRAVPRPASGPHGAVRAARFSAPGPPSAQTATCARLDCLYLLGGDGQCVAITAPARLVRRTGPCAVRSAGARQLVRPVPASRRRDPADGSHVEMSLCRHPEIHLTVLARGAQLTEPVRREPRLRQSRQ